MVVLVGPCFFLFPFGWVELGWVLGWVSAIGIRLPGGRPHARLHLSQTFHFAEGHGPPLNESHSCHDKTESRKDSHCTVMQQPSFETQTLLNVHLINVPQRALTPSLLSLRVPFLFLTHTISAIRSCHSSCFPSLSHF